MKLRVTIKMNNGRFGVISMNIWFDGYREMVHWLLQPDNHKFITLIDKVDEVA